MSAILIMLAVYAIGIAAYVATLALAGRWLKYPKRKPGRLSAIGLLSFVLTLSSFVVVLWLADSSAKNPEMLDIGIFLLATGAEVLLIQFGCATTFGRALAGWGMTVATRILLVVVILLGIRRPFVEAYRLPTMSMAPTIVSRHAVTTCPKCGGTVLYSLDPETIATNNRFLSAPAKRAMVSGTCINCAEDVSSLVEDLKALPGDRFMVSKFLAPARWDLVAFHYHDAVALKRVVGLPGEEICIDSAGILTVDGKRVMIPAEIPGGAYRWPLTNGQPLPEESFALHANEKLRLGADEYFMLGDNSMRSLDSRMHGPVKKADVVGVVTWTYWPLNRMRIFR